MYDDIEVDEVPLLAPHPFIRCEGQHLFGREEHCAIPGCGRPKDDEIHAEVAAA